MAKRKPRPITARNACDTLASKIVRSLGYCQRCGRTDRLECAHIVGRGQGAWTRTDLGNLWCLCTWCHRETHRDAMEFAVLVRRTIGQDEYARLRRKANNGVGVKFDWFAERERLKRIHAEVFA